MPEPQFRPLWSQLALAIANNRIPAQTRQIEAAIGEETVRRVVHSRGFVWMPAALQMQVFDGFEAVLEPLAARRFWRDVQLRAFRSKLESPLVEGALRLFGRSPRSILRMAPQIYSLVSRHAGTSSLQPGPEPNSAVWLVADMPDELIVHRSFLDALHGNCEATIQHLQMEGEVERFVETGGQNRVHYIARWR
jgi:hypothetical protein